MKDGSSNLGIGCIHFTLLCQDFDRASFITFDSFIGMCDVFVAYFSGKSIDDEMQSSKAKLVSLRHCQQVISAKRMFFSSKPPQATNVPFCVLQHHLFSWNSTLKVQGQEIELVSKLVEALFHIHAMWSVHVPFPLPPSPLLKLWKSNNALIYNDLMGWKVGKNGTWYVKNSLQAIGKGRKWEASKAKGREIKFMGIKYI